MTWQATIPRLSNGLLSLWRLWVCGQRVALSKRSAISTAVTPNTPVTPPRKTEIAVGSPSPDRTRSLVRCWRRYPHHYWNQTINAVKQRRRAAFARMLAAADTRADVEHEGGCGL